jgi:sortase A
VRRGLVTGVLGRVIFGAGVLILLFVAYQLWGTDLKESHSQAVLRQRFETELHDARTGHGTTTTTTSPPSSTTTTSSPSTTTSTTSPGDQPTVGATMAAPGDGSPVGILRIPTIGVDKVIVQGTSTSDLQQGPGHYPGTPLPGEAGNAAIAGHRTTYGAPFYNLDELAPGDSIDVTTVQGSFTYSVTSTQVVSPSDVAVVADTTEPELTLTTCNPRFSASQRLVVHAVLTGTPAPTAPPPRSTPSSPSSPSKSTSRSATASGLAGGQGDWLPALWLGLLWAAVVGAMFGVARRRSRRRARWAVYTVGGAVSLVALFFFFGAVSPLLPASF